jgi:hypothetical protein
LFTTVLLRPLPLNSHVLYSITTIVAFEFEN